MGNHPTVRAMVPSRYDVSCIDWARGWLQRLGGGGGA
jgi:hypothetical protein